MASGLLWNRGPTGSVGPASYHWALLCPSWVFLADNPVVINGRLVMIARCLLQCREKDCFLLLECLVFRDLLSLCVLTSKLLFFRHGMPHSVPVHPPWPYPDVLHHGCHAEHGQVQLLRWQVRNTDLGWGWQKPWQSRSLIVAELVGAYRTSSQA